MEKKIFMIMLIFYGVLYGKCIRFTPCGNKGENQKEWVEAMMTQHLTQNKEDIWNRDVRKNRMAPDSSRGGKAYDPLLRGFKQQINC